VIVWSSSHVPVCQVQSLGKALSDCQPGSVCKQVQADCVAHAGQMRSDSKLLCAPSLHLDCAVLLHWQFAELLLCATCHLAATCLKMATWEDVVPSLQKQVVCHMLFPHHISLASHWQPLLSSSASFRLNRPLPCARAGISRCLSELA
jgi:hypothetical protein